MKTISARELQQRIRQTLDVSQKERVVITRHGRPAALMVGMEGYDWEDVYWALNPAFWKMIQGRRRQKGIPIEEARRLLETGWARRPTRGRPAHRGGNHRPRRTERSRAR